MLAAKVPLQWPLGDGDEFSRPCSRSLLELRASDRAEEDLTGDSYYSSRRTTKKTKTKGPFCIVSQKLSLSLSPAAAADVCLESVASFFCVASPLSRSTAAAPPWPWKTARALPSSPGDCRPPADGGAIQGQGASRQAGGNTHAGDGTSKPARGGGRKESWVGNRDGRTGEKRARAIPPPPRRRRRREPLRRSLRLRRERESLRRRRRRQPQLATTPPPPPP